MRILLLVAAFSAAILAQRSMFFGQNRTSAPAHCTPVSGYGFCREIDFPSSDFSSTLTNYPASIIGTYAYLATTGNGGELEDAQGDDVVFADFAGTTGIPYCRQAWSATTGAVVYHVLLASASSSTGAKVYMSYGNASVTTDQTDCADTFVAYTTHFKMNDNAGSATVVDSLGVNNGSLVGDNTSSNTTSGKVGDALLLNSLSSYDNANWITFADPTVFDLPGATDGWTFKTWMYAESAAQAGTSSYLFKGENSGNAQSLLRMFFLQSGPEYQIQVRADNATGLTTSATGTETIFGAWHHVAFTRSTGKAWTVYLDGVSIHTVSDTMTAGVTLDTQTTLGNQQGAELSYNGKLDEPAWAASELPEAWIDADVANANSPGTFYTVGSDS